MSLEGRHLHADVLGVFSLPALENDWFIPIKGTVMAECSTGFKLLGMRKILLSVFYSYITLSTFFFFNTFHFLKHFHINHII